MPSKSLTRSRARVKPVRTKPPSGNGHADAPISRTRGQAFYREVDDQLCYMTTRGKEVEILGVSAFLPQDILRAMEEDPEWGKQPEPPTYEVITGPGDKEVVVMSEHTLPPARPAPAPPLEPVAPADFTFEQAEAWRQEVMAESQREYDEDFAKWQEEQALRGPWDQYVTALNRWNAEHLERVGKAMLFLGTRVDLPTADSKWVTLRKALNLYTPDPADTFNFTYFYIMRELLGNIQDDMAGLLETISYATGLDPEAAKSGGEDVPDNVDSEGRPADELGESAI